LSRTRQQQQGQRRIFDAAYAGMDRYDLENWRVAYIQRIFPALGLRGRRAKGYRFLDVGIGGLGYTVVEAARLGADAWGVDLSPVGIRQAAASAAQTLTPAQLKRCRFRVSPAEELPFAAASFDGVASIAVLEHVAEHQRALAEIARVLKPGGRAYVAVPHCYAKTPWLLGLLNRINDRLVGHLRHYSRQDLADLAQACGLQVERVIYHGHSVKLLQFALERLLPSMRRPKDARWWRLEQRDRDQEHDDRASMISVVLHKAAARRSRGR
jgi:ubiquinone/menaquinone biosynthesis C-methylase UbiE